MQCLNTSNKEIAALLKEYTEILGSEDAAYYVLSENNGYGLDRAPNGAPSKLFSDLLSHYNGDRKLAIAKKSLVYTNNFKNWFGDWLNVGSNIDYNFFEEYADDNTTNGKLIRTLLDNYINPSDISEIVYNKFGTSGNYIADTKQLTIPVDESEPLHTRRKVVAHELMHVATAKYCDAYIYLKDGLINYNASDSYIKNLPKLTEEQIKSFDRLSEIKQQVVDYLNNNPEEVDRIRKKYGDAFGVVSYFTIDPENYNLHEFLSEAFTNPALIEVMSQIRTKDNKLSIFDKFVNALSKIFGFDISSTLFGETVSEVSKILRNKNNVSKVVDENGEPLITWHSSPVKGITNFLDSQTETISKDMEWIFNKDLKDYLSEGYEISKEQIEDYNNGKTIDIHRPNAIYAASNRSVSESYITKETEEEGLYLSGEVYPIYISIKDVEVVDAKESHWNNIQYDGKKVSTRDLEKLFRNKKDGVIVEDVYDFGSSALFLDKSNLSDVFIVYNTNQIKSIDNQGAFSTSDNNVYNQEAQSQTGTGRNQQLANILQELYPDIEIGELNDPNLRGQAQVEGYMAGRVLLNAILENQDTLPHEYAHHYIAWFRNAPLVQKGIKRFGSEEALVQAIGENSLNAIKWYKRLLNVIKGLFSKKQRVLNKLTNDFLHGTNLGTATFSGTETHFQIANTGIPKRVQKTYDRIMEGLERRISDVEFSKYKGNRENELRRLQFELNRAENDKATLEFIDYMADDIIHQLQELQSMRTAYNNYRVNGTPHGITQDHLDIIRKGFIGFYSNLITNIQDMLDDPTTFEHFKDKHVVDSARNSMRVTLGQFNEAVRLFNGIVDSIAKDELMSEAAKSGQWTVDEMNRILDEGDFDINWWDRYIGQAQYINNPMIQLLLNKMIGVKRKVYDQTLDKGKDLLDALDKVDKSKLKLLWEKDEKGNKTGFLTSPLNRGKHRQDFIKFKQELAKKLGYENEDLEGLEDKLTDEQYKIWSQEINKWDAEHTERRFLPEYYEITNTLSLEARRRRDQINDEIKIILLPTIDDNGNFHRELLSDEEYAKLEALENQRRNLANNFYPDGTEKLGLDKQVAEEFQEYNKRLRDRLNYKPNVQKFAEAYRHAKRTLSKELFKKWLDRNTVVRITDAFYEELQKLGTGIPKSDLQVELEEARRQLLKLYMDSEGNIDTEAMPIQVKQMIVEYDDMIKQEALSHRIPGVKSKIWQIATWEVNPEYEIQLAEAQRRGGDALQFWLSNNTVQTENGIEPASFWKRLVPKPEFRKYYMERIPNRSWSEIDKESPLYNPNFDESLGESRIPKKSLYENKDFERIQSDPQLKLLYDKLLETLSESIGKINFLRYSNTYRLPQIEGNVWTQIAGSDNVLKGLGHASMSSLQVRPEDEIYNNMTKALRSDGSAVKLIPTRYIKMLDNPNLITEDIVGSVIHFYKMATNYQLMSELAPEMETILDFASRLEIKKSGSGELLDTKSSKFYQKLESLVNDLVYGEESNPMTFTIFGKQISFDKIAQGLANYTRKVGIAHNLNVILTGLVTNKVQNKLTAIEGIYFNNAELRAASSIVQKSYLNALANVGNANNKNKVLCLLEYVGVVRDAESTFRDLQRNRISRTLVQHFWYFGHEIVDYITKAKSVIALALHSKYVPTEGKFMTRNEFMRKYSNKKQGKAAWKALTTTLYDAFEVKNNKLVVKDEYKDVLDEFTLNRFRNTCKQLGTRIDTQLTDLDRSWSQTNTFGKLIFINRNWLITWLQNKVFTRPQFNIVSGMYQDNQAHAAWKALQGYFNPKKLDQLRELYKENFDEVDEYNKAALRRTTIELVTAYIIAFIVSTVLSAVGEDDKDNFYKNETALIAARAGVELRNNILPIEGLNLFNNPSAAWSTLQSFGDFTAIYFNDPEKEVRSGPYKGMERWQRSLIKATPLRSIYEAQDPRAKLQYYENFILFNS